MTFDDNRLSASAANFIDRAAAEGHRIALSAFILVERIAVPDMPNRIVAATALYFSVPVISRDRRIGTSSVQTVW